MSNRNLALLDRDDVLDITKQGRSSLYARCNPKSPSFDPTFPVPVRIGSSSVRWIASEIEAWIESRPRARKRVTENSAKGSE